MSIPAAKSGYTTSHASDSTERPPIADTESNQARVLNWMLPGGSRQSDDIKRTLHASPMSSRYIDLESPDYTIAKLGVR